jgi:arsenite methyltransferase
LHPAFNVPVLFVQEEAKMKQPGFFDFAAEVGLTKHIGGMRATEELINLCRINKDTYVLDVGCGAGVTPCYLAGKYGCRVMGVDILEGMVTKSRERARRARLEERVEFRTTDVQQLPFENDLFDVVLTESVMVFPENKQRAIRECARVIKPGGFVGLNESTWLKSPPPAELAAWVSQDLGANVELLTSEGWQAALTAAGLKVVSAQSYVIEVKDETRGILQRYGCGGMLGVFSRMLALYIRNASYRDFVRRVGRGGITPANLDEYYGYGLYVACK